MSKSMENTRVFMSLWNSRCDTRDLRHEKKDLRHEKRDLRHEKKRKKNQEACSFHALKGHLI